MTKYTIRYSGQSVEMSRPSSTILVYKIPYRDVKLRNYGFSIDNPFIVYILFGRNDKGKDYIYVGKSKNGLSNRPTAHDDKYDGWTTCFVLTQFQERTFFNDGTIQYLEDKLNKTINSLGSYQNTTETTTSGTANKSDEEDCDSYLEEAQDMLMVLGLDLFTEASGERIDAVVINVKTESANIVPDGRYFMDRKLKKEGNSIIKATMRVEDGTFIVEAGSMIARHDGIGMPKNVVEFRNDNAFVKNGILMKEVKFDSPSGAGCLVIGASCDGWTEWKTESGQSIDVYRIKEKQANG